jgi:hypothetical protein
MERETLSQEAVFPVHHEVRLIRLLPCFLSFLSVLQLLVSAYVPSLLILFTLKMETTRSSEMLVLTRATQHRIQEDDILQVEHAVLLFLCD